MAKVPVVGTITVESGSGAQIGSFVLNTRGDRISPFGGGTVAGDTNSPPTLAVSPNPIVSDGLRTAKSTGSTALKLIVADGVPGLAAFWKGRDCDWDVAGTGGGPKSTGEVAGTRLMMSPRGVSESATW